ncbi:RNA-binding cell elongation regulator Jag/EloR [Sporosarcina sp. HYO08]|uniref:RNA-binding cell elongation regulator Jag/EloR n=1 Tax=Sporosarcina sp. HYO08 TaxID=1759557 RepID=UPI00079441EF|nr:RNA-binding cell elongation regulator Jag/EloR [Sporosarcina sp. HYO08]KXH80582.1 protein jag [Sporosarcina sp. HYO08]
MKRITRRGATVEVAISSALATLGVTRDEVEVEIIEEGRKGFLGFGAKEAEVTVTVIREEPSVLEQIAPAEEIQAQTVEVPAETEEESKQKTEEKVEENEQQVEPKEARAQLSDEAAIAETEQYLKDVAKQMGILDLNVSHEIEGKYVMFQLDSSKAAFLIGKRGQTLNAIQQLAQLIANKSAEQFKVVRVNVGDYRERREQSLEQLAERMADRASRTGERVQLEPMPSHERKIIHNALSNRMDIETYSEGTDPHRYLVIEAIK